MFHPRWDQQLLHQDKHAASDANWLIGGDDLDKTEQQQQKLRVWTRVLLNPPKQGPGRTDSVIAASDPPLSQENSQIKPYENSYENVRFPRPFLHVQQIK